MMRINSFFSTHFKLVLLNDALFNMLPNLMDDSKHGNVGLSSTRWGTDEKVLIAVVSHWVHHRLDSVQSGAAPKCHLTNLGEGEKNIYIPEEHYLTSSKTNFLA